MNIKGKVLRYDICHNLGIIAGNDGKEYFFRAGNIIDHVEPIFNRECMILKSHNVKGKNPVADKVIFY